MNVKLKIALLALLGFSTASCASKRAAKKSADCEQHKIETDSVDTRIMLMYGVPSPDGRPVLIEEESQAEGVKYPDGNYAKPLTDEEAERLKEQIRAEKEAADSLDLQISVMYGVPFPDGSVVKEYKADDAEAKNDAKEYPDGDMAKPLTDEAAQELLDKVRAEKEAMKAAEAEKAE